jgi:hypothetical protein
MSTFLHPTCSHLQVLVLVLANHDICVVTKLPEDTSVSFNFLLEGNTARRSKSIDPVPSWVCNCW